MRPDRSEPEKIIQDLLAIGELQGGPILREEDEHRAVIPLGDKEAGMFKNPAGVTHVNFATAQTFERLRELGNQLLQLLRMKPISIRAMLEGTIRSPQAVGGHAGQRQAAIEQSLEGRSHGRG